MVGLRSPAFWALRVTCHRRAQLDQLIGPAGHADACDSVVVLARGVSPRARHPCGEGSGAGRIPSSPPRCRVRSKNTARNFRTPPPTTMDSRHAGRTSAYRPLALTPTYLLGSRFESWATNPASWPTRTPGWDPIRLPGGLSAQSGSDATMTRDEGNRGGRSASETCREHSGRSADPRGDCGQQGDRRQRPAPPGLTSRSRRGGASFCAVRTAAARPPCYGSSRGRWTPPRVSPRSTASRRTSVTRPSDALSPR